MANTNGTLAGALIAQEVLPILQDTYPVLNDIVTNFSDEPVLFNQNVITKIPTIGSSQAYSTTTGYAAASGTLTDVTVNVGTHEYWAFSLNDQELSGSPLNLVKTYSEAFAAAIGAKLMTDLTALFTESNFTGTPTTQAISGATVANVIGAANTALNSRKVQQTGRYAILTSLLAGALRNDSTNVYITAGGVGITTAQMASWQGVKPTDFADLPGNSINLIGVVGAKDSIVLLLLEFLKCRLQTPVMLELFPTSQTLIQVLQSKSANGMTSC